MSIYSDINPFFAPYPLFGQSVFVISDTDWVACKQKQLQREIEELEKLQASYQASIDRVQKTIDLLKKDLPSQPNETLHREEGVSLPTSGS